MSMIADTVQSPGYQSGFFMNSIRHVLCCIFALMSITAYADADYDKFVKTEKEFYSGDTGKCKEFKKFVNSKLYILCTNKLGKPVEIHEVGDPVTEEGGIDVFFYQNGKLVSRCDPDHFGCVGFKAGAAFVSWSIAGEKSVVRWTKNPESQAFWNEADSISRKVISAPVLEEFPMTPENRKYKQFYKTELKQYELDTYNLPVTKSSKTIRDTIYELEVLNKQPVKLFRKKKIKSGGSDDEHKYEFFNGKILSGCSYSVSVWTCVGFKNGRIVRHWDPANRKLITTLTKDQLLNLAETWKTSAEADLAFFGLKLKR